MIKIKSLKDFKSNKVIDFKTAAKKIRDIKTLGKTAGLCHGGFDLLHPGHIKHFESARRLCDCLLVSITSDRFVASRKGLGRPIFSDKLRAYSVAGIEFVDFVVISDFKKGIEVIKKLKPSYYIKGPDFVSKTTPGITLEREAIKSVGGEIRYTTDIKVSTTEIIKYIKEKIRENKFLLILDRDGTIIKNDNFFGRESDWRKKLTMNKPIIDLLYDFQLKTNSVKIVVSNQAGVARGYFSCKRVEDIHAVINKELTKGGIVIDDWQYCPDADLSYAISKGIDGFNKKFVRKKTKRKPSAAMVLDSLRKLGKKLEDFEKIIVTGNQTEDKELADNLGALFINIEGESCKNLKKKFNKICNL